MCDVEREEFAARNDLYQREFEVFDALRELRVTKAGPERRATKAILRATASLETEQEERRSIVVQQSRCRNAIAVQAARSHVCVVATEKMQLLKRAEDRKRYCLEKHEVTEYAELTSAYSQTPWKPTIKMLGQCPFARKVDCPFHDQRKMCHGIPLSENHYENSQVDVVGAEMM
jgi:hypothetical protein